MHTYYSMHNYIKKHLDYISIFTVHPWNKNTVVSSKNKLSEHFLTWIELYICADKLKCTSTHTSCCNGEIIEQAGFQNEGSRTISGEHIFRNKTLFNIKCCWLPTQNVFQILKFIDLVLKLYTLTIVNIK